MEKFKEVFLKTIKKTTSIVSILAVILTVLAGVLAIFYDEINAAFIQMGMSQEQLAWATVALGGLGTAGVLTTQVSRGLKTALVLNKTDQERIQKDYEKEMNKRINRIEKESEARMRNLEAEHELKMSQLEDRNNDLHQRVVAYEDLLEKQVLFDRAQAQKYVDAPDRLVSKEAKEAYQLYLDATEDQEV